MDVFGRIVGGDRAVDAARGDDRDLALEGTKRFEDQRHAAHRGVDAGGVLVADVAEDALALAVIADAAGLQDAAAAESSQRRGQIGVAVDGAESRRSRCRCR